MAQAIHSKKVVSGLTKLSAVQTAQAIYLFKKKKTAIRMAWAIHSKKLLTVQAPGVICSMKNFSQVSIPKQFHCQPLLSNDLLFSRYSWVVKLRTLFTNASWIVTVPLLLLYSHLRYYNNYYHSIIDRIDTRFIQNVNFVQLVLWK